MNPEELKAQLAELEKQLKAAATAEAKALLEAQKKDIEQKLADLTKDVPELRKELNEAKTELKTATETIKVLKDAADKNQEVIDKFVAGEGTKIVKAESFNDLLSKEITAKGDDIRKVVEARKTGRGSGIEIDLKTVGDMTFSGNASTLNVGISTLKPGIIERPSRKVHVRELIPGGTMSNSTYVVLRETTGFQGNPATVAEGNWKEQVDEALEEVAFNNQYVAGYLVASTKMFDDISGFVSFLQNRLLERLLRAEDVQLLYGSGVAPNLSGITTSGNFTSVAQAGGNDAEQLIKAIAQLEGLDRQCTGILVHPRDFFQMLLWKSTSFYTLPGNPAFGMISYDNGVMRIAGVPVYRSTAMREGKFIAGDWDMGANIITREAPKIEIFYQDGYNVRRNQVTVRVEERIAFPIYGADYFIYGVLGLS